MFTVVTALLGILTAALADPIVVERRLSLETRIQPLQKRDNTCVGSIQGMLPSTTPFTSCRLPKSKLTPTDAQEKALPSKPRHVSPVRPAATAA